MKFKDLALIPPLQRAVADAGYTDPSPIQEKAIPPVLAGRDLLGCAQTGTGKTAAFALPILQLLTAREPGGKGKRPIRCLVLTPTRELALQIQENFEMYGKYLPLVSAVIFGGVGQGPQVAKLRKGVDILVATPGRLNDLIGQGHIKLGETEIFVLDEADRMLDMGFVNDVKKVLKFLPEKKQTLLFSATMPDEIVDLANSLLHKPSKVFVTPVSSTVESIDQSLYKVDKANKRKLLAQLLKDPGVVSALVFTRTKHGADRVARDLTRAGVKAMAIHGNKSQGARQEALARFKDGRIRVLVATDIAARGLDINELSHVFNYDLPNIPETYVHRIGRTGRAGHGGTAISFCCVDELPYLADIERLIGFKVPEIADHAWPMQMMEPAPKSAQNGRGQKQNAPKAPKQQKQPGNPKKGRTGGQAKAQKAPPAPQPTKAPAAKPQNQAAAPAAKAQGIPQPQQGRKQQGKNGQRPRKGGPRPPFDPYENLTGGKSIVTKKPVWSTSSGPSTQVPDEGDVQMSRGNRRRGGKNRNKKNTKPENKGPEIRKNEKGVFDFTEEELSEDEALKVVSRSTGETKYASFEDFLKDQ